jgi:rSAM/selenodomain-associated transferase 1
MLSRVHYRGATSGRSRGILSRGIQGLRYYGHLMSPPSIVILFIKAPVRGQVKSRLAAAIGEELALELYRRFILDIIDTVNASNNLLRICYSPPDAGNAIADWPGQGYPAMPQQGDDLGVRMENAFCRIFSEGAASAVLIGSDIPDLPVAIIRDAFDALTRSDAVIGPASDGGYYLIGFNRDAFLPSLFHGIPWSTDRVFSETMKSFKETSLRVWVLQEWSDVDTIEDLRALLLRNRDPETKGSRTLSFLMDQRGRIDI